MVRILAVVYSFWLILSWGSWAQAIEVGVAVEDITPPTGVMMWGYSARKEPSNGVLDPLYSKAVVFDDGETQAALVSLDLGRTPPEESMEWIFEQAKRRLDVEQVLLVATHTHAGPFMGYANQEEPWLKVMNEAIVQSISRALNNKQPARFEYGEGELDITYDRRRANPDGTVTMLWRNPERNETPSVDQTIKVLHIASRDGEPIATLVHYAAHPVMTGSQNRKLSAGFPAWTCQAIEEEMGGIGVYIQGACGEINPYLAGILEREPEAYEKIMQEGRKLGEKVVEIAEHLTPIESGNLTIKTHNQYTQLGLRYEFDDERIQTVLNGLYGREWIEDFEQSERQLTARTSFLQLGEELAWVGFPGEFFDDFQMDLDRRSPVPHTFFAGYCNGYLSYFPTIRASAEGGYGADYGLLAETGAGERLLDRAIIGLYEMLEMLP